MGRTLAARLSRALAGCYPRRWRQRYGEELLEVLDQHHAGMRTVLNLAASALGAHLDPAYRMELLPMIRTHKKGLAAAATVLGGLMVLVLLAGIVAWQDDEGNQGPPPPLSQGVFGVAFSPDGRTVATINTNLEIWNAADPGRPERLGYSRGDIVSGDKSGVLPGRARPGHRRRQDRDLVERGPPLRSARPDYRPAGRSRRGERGRVLPGRAHPGQRLRRRHGGLVEHRRPGPRHPHRYPHPPARRHCGAVVLPRRAPAGRAQASTARWPCGTSPARPA